MKWRLTYRRYRLPFRVPMRTAHGEWAEREGLLVRLEGESAAVGYGEAAPIPWFGTETAEEAEAACRLLGDRVDEERLAAVPVKLTCLRHALAAALVDLDQGGDGLVAPKPDEGGRPARPSPRSSLPVAALLPGGRAALAVAASKAEAGFRVFKWKVGITGVSDELVLLDDLCAVLPSGAKLRLDANGAWDRRAAERWLKRCAERPVEFVEQPVAPDLRGADDLLLGLAGEYPTPLALDESLVGEGDVDHWLGAGWPGVFVIKPSLLGDAAGALSRLAAARAAVVFSSALETAVGARSSLRTAFAWPGEARALGFGIWPLFADSRFDGPWETPFLRWEEVERIDPEAVWNALN